MRLLTVSASPHFVVQTSHVEFEKEEDDAVMLTHQLASAAAAPVDDTDHSEAVQAAPVNADGEEDDKEEEDDEDLDLSLMGKGHLLTNIWS